MNDHKEQKTSYYGQLTGYRRAMPIILLAIGLFFSICVFSNGAGILGAGIGSVLRGAISWGGFAVPFVMAIHALCYAEDVARKKLKARVVFSVLAVFFTSVIEYSIFFWGTEARFAPMEFYSTATSGGFVGSFFGFALTKILGHIGVIILAAAVLGIYATFFFADKAGRFGEKILAVGESIFGTLAVVEGHIKKNVEEKKEAKALQEEEAHILRSDELIADQFFTNIGVSDLTVKDTKNVDDSAETFEESFTKSVNAVQTPIRRRNASKPLDLSYGIEEVKAPEEPKANADSEPVPAPAPEKNENLFSLGLDDSAENVFAGGFDPFNFAADEKRAIKPSSRTEIKEEELDEFTKLELRGEPTEKEKRRMELEEKKRQWFERKKAETAASAPQTDTPTVASVTKTTVSETVEAPMEVKREESPEEVASRIASAQKASVNTYSSYASTQTTYTQPIKTVEFTISSDPSMAPTASHGLTGEPASVPAEKRIDPDTEDVAAVIAERIARSNPAYARSANEMITYTRVTRSPEEMSAAEPSPMDTLADAVAQMNAPEESTPAENVTADSQTIEFGDDAESDDYLFPNSKAIGADTSPEAVNVARIIESLDTSSSADLTFDNTNAPVAFSADTNSMSEEVITDTPPVAVSDEVLTQTETADPFEKEAVLPQPLNESESAPLAFEAQDEINVPITESSPAEGSADAVDASARNAYQRAAAFAVNADEVTFEPEAKNYTVPSYEDYSVPAAAHAYSHASVASDNTVYQRAEDLTPRFTEPKSIPTIEDNLYSQPFAKEVAEATIQPMVQTAAQAVSQPAVQVAPQIVPQPAVQVAPQIAPQPAVQAEPQIAPQPAVQAEPQIAPQPAVQAIPVYNTPAESAHVADTVTFAEAAETQETAPVFAQPELAISFDEDVSEEEQVNSNASIADDMSWNSSSEELDSTDEEQPANDPLDFSYDPEFDSEEEAEAPEEIPDEEIDAVTEEIPPEEQNPDVIKMREMFPFLTPIGEQPTSKAPAEEFTQASEEPLVEQEEDDAPPFDIPKAPAPTALVSMDDVKAEEKKSNKPDYSNYEFPSIDLLAKQEASSDDNIQAEIQENADKLIETLASFGVSASIKGVDRGPRITRYEVVPAKGVKVSAILNLQDDIALNLAAGSIRMEAPIPGKSAVGIEIPNKKSSIVRLRDLIETEDFCSSKSKTAVCIGRDVAGQPVFGDIAKMPHLLIAGATGMGKSVCINSLMISMLYKARPDEVKFIMIDPKQVEFTMYNGIPHLLVPVVSDAKQAAGALMWAVEEMEKRYNLLNPLCVRNVEAYNEKVMADPSLGEPMSKIVIVIDEFADLMLQVKDPVETLVMRIAQKARAAGIYLIIGTQRPSVNVITGVIKANVPSRISCKVMSNVDSKTVLDSAGAEKLLDRGDALYAPAGSPKPHRVQCAFVADSEVEAIMAHLKKFSDGSNYDSSVMEEIERAAQKCSKKGGGGGNDADDGDDDIHGEGYLNDRQFLDAVEVAVNTRKISTSLIQRKLSIGYGKAAKFIDIMEDMGIVGEANGQRPREVLITPDEWREKLARATLD